MDYVGQVPAPPLDRFIDDIYCLTGVPRHRRMNVPPMPSAHLFVNLGEPVRLWNPDLPTHRARDRSSKRLTSMGVHVFEFPLDGAGVGVVEVGEDVQGPLVGIDGGGRVAGGVVSVGEADESGG